MFQELPTTLKTEISKPSAKQEAVEMVLSGDIKTTKEFKELERKLKESEERNKRLAEQALKQEVVEKEVVIEKVPEDYQDLKSRVKSTEERNQFLEKNLQELYAKRSEVDEKSAKYDELTEAIKQSQGQLNSYQRRIASYKNFMSLFQKADQLIMEISGLAYSKETQLIDLDGLVKSEFNDLVDRGLKLFNDLDKKRQPQNILEGELL
jgi:chromosome segregation ATPase